MSEKNEKKSGFNPVGLLIGLGIGLCYGTALGNMGAGICLGMSVGLCFCVALGNLGTKKEEQQSAQQKEKQDEQQ